jgi:hypothetical protein
MAHISLILLLNKKGEFVCYLQIQILPHSQITGECFDWNTNIKEFVRNLQNTQLQSNPNLNELSNELFCIQNRIFNKKNYDGFIRLQSSFQIFASKCVVIFVMVSQNWLKFGI